jgi:ACS family hexuronate transporter-like MFS transporter
MNKQKIGNYRWRIVALLFFATTLNYIDRQVIGILAPYLEPIFGWSEADYSFIIAGFQLAYMIGLIIMGGLIDRLGTKNGYSLAIIIWSIAGMLHAAARSVISFAAARFSLGFGESANFPAAIKSIAEWFPKRERALATGLMNSGSNVGAIVAPLLVPFIAIQWGWEWAFIGTGALGFIWLVFWMPFYKRPEVNQKLSKKEKDYILQDGEESLKKIPWIKIFPHKQTIGICLARFFTDPIWWFFLYWLPKFLAKNHDIDLEHIGLPLIIIYSFSSIGSIFGGWISSFFIKRGIHPVTSRKRSILIMAFLVVPIFYASITSNVWIAIALISLATFAHQGYAANIFTIVSDIYPKNAVGSMTGLAGFAGAVGGLLFTIAVGQILEVTGNYYIIFGIASVMYLFCWLSLKLFVPYNKKIIVN